MKDIILGEASMMYNNYLHVPSSTYTPQQCIKKFSLPNFTHGLITKMDSDVNYSAVIFENYILNIGLKNINSIQSCDDAQNYLFEYLSKIDTSALRASDVK